MQAMKIQPALQGASFEQSGLIKSIAAGPGGG